MCYVRMNIHVYALCMYVHECIYTCKNSRVLCQYLVSVPIKERTTCNYAASLTNLFLPLTRVCVQKCFFFCVTKLYKT